MKIRLDVEACVGHGRCYAIAPEVFDADDQGHGVIRPDAGETHDGSLDVAVHLEAVARSGAANCPENAILIAD